MPTRPYRNTAPVVVDVGDGRMVAPGDVIDVDPKKSPAAKAGLLEAVQADTEEGDA